MSVAFLIWDKFIRRILTFGITLPLWLFLAAGVWLYVDKASAVRTAVNDAATKLVAGAEIEALQVQLLEERRVRAWEDGKADEARLVADKERAARTELATQLAITEDEKKGLADDLQAVRERESDTGCVVDQFLFDRLRNK